MSIGPLQRWALFAAVLLSGCAGATAMRHLQQQLSDLPLGTRQKLVSLGTLVGGQNKHKLVLPQPGAKFVRDSFIVSLDDNVTGAQVQGLVGSLGKKVVSVTDISGPAFKGLALEAPPGLLQQAAVFQELLELGSVTLVEVDSIRSIGVDAATTDTAASWGLDRIDQRTLPLSGTYSYNSTAPDVLAYVIDTGILKTHTQFIDTASGASRVIGGTNFVPRRSSSSSLSTSAAAGKKPPKGGGGGGGGGGNSDYNDCDGHGTHVAGTIGGKDYGVAKDVKLVAVRVLDCHGSGRDSWVIQGINWVTADCATRAATNGTASRKCVANMSLGGSLGLALDRAVANSINSGVVYAVAAGNADADACTTSPARVLAAITVAATDDSDTRATFSNFGACVDIFAPGVRITSAYRSSPTAVATFSGTSMAAPHVAGVVALYLSALPSSMLPAAAAAVPDALKVMATQNTVRNPSPGSPNLLLFTDL